MTNDDAIYLCDNLQGFLQVFDRTLDKQYFVVEHAQRGFTPLHMAAKFGKLKVAQLLLDKGADANVEGKYKLTPLHVSTHYGTTDVALLLLDRDAKPQCAAKVRQ